MVFEKFLSNAEVDALVARGAEQGFDQSVDAGKKGDDGKFEKIVSQVTGPPHSFMKRIWIARIAAASHPFLFVFSFFA